MDASRSLFDTYHSKQAQESILMLRNPHIYIMRTDF